ncbi:site-specific DNA-methyltransferase [bacterium]|nr:site-specific DNA-methyltransferase [bacterium]
MIKLLKGDCLQVLKSLPDNSVDSLVSDPPAGIAFMGKGWDEDKGHRDLWILWLSKVMKECKRVMKPGAHGLVWAIPRTSHWTGMALENSGFEVRDVVSHLFGQGFPKSLDISKAIDKTRCEGALANSASKEAKDWEGWGTALKPAVEFWFLIRKPIEERSVASNVLKHGTGGINIDASRIETEEKLQAGRGINKTDYNSPSGYKTSNRAPYIQATKGRFPSNLVLSHNAECKEDQCTDDCAVKLLDDQSGPCKTGELTGQPRVENKVFGKAGSTLGKPRYYQPDLPTGASRFFYCAKISSGERNAGLDSMPKKPSGAYGEFAGDGRGRQTEHTPSANHHPTVKPIKLMRYLTRLITPPKGIVLDPFMGSGTTGVASLKEGFGFIGIEKEAEYFEICKARITQTKKLLDQINEKKEAKREKLKKAFSIKSPIQDKA